MRATDALDIMEGKRKEAMLALIAIYGDDTEIVLNELHAIAARIAILTGVTPEKFSAGVKHHWDFLAAAINDDRPAKPIN